jgi:hypothetical protein
MKLITPGELVEAFRDARSLAVIGNAPTVKEHHNGALIDDYDVVVRFNRIQTAGLEEAIGTRTDILCVNAANSLQKAPSPAGTTRPKYLVCFMSPQGCGKADFTAFCEWVGELPILLTFGPDLIGLTPTARSRPLTSGTYILFTLLQLLTIERLFVTGFTMFGAVSGGAGKVYEDKHGAAGAFHDIDQESRILAELLSQFRGELTVTPEVRELLERDGSQVTANGVRSMAVQKERIGKRVARRLSWRLMEAALALRRIAEART